MVNTPYRIIPQQYYGQAYPCCDDKGHLTFRVVYYPSVTAQSQQLGLNVNGQFQQLGLDVNAQSQQLGLDVNAQSQQLGLDVNAQSQQLGLNVNATRFTPLISNNTGVARLPGFYTIFNIAIPSNGVSVAYDVSTDGFKSPSIFP